MSSDEDNSMIEYSSFSEDEEEELPRTICLTSDGVDQFLSEEVRNLQQLLSLNMFDETRMLLHYFNWDAAEVVRQFTENSALTLLQAGIFLPAATSEPATDNCLTCLEVFTGDGVFLKSLGCGHAACNSCWLTYLEMEIGAGRSTQISCMEYNCTLHLPQPFVCQTIPQSNESLRDRYLQFCRNEWVQGHPKLLPCPGENCPVVVGKDDQSQKQNATCSECRTQICLDCGRNYHAPTDCSSLKKWLLLSTTDGKTAVYIKNHTKDCPSCGVPINKDGGCHWMQCSKCLHEFCWLCRAHMKHNDTYRHTCNKFKDDTHDGNSSSMAKFGFYAGRWESHAEALRLEKATHEKIRQRINARLAAGEGNWIDWQYLFEAAEVLENARYTLQYTYPFAYFLPADDRRKAVFEFQQAEMEYAVEDLSYKLERADISERAAIANQKDIVEKQRRAVLASALEANC